MLAADALAQPLASTLSDYLLPGACEVPFRAECLLQRRSMAPASSCAYATPLTASSEK
jgi:hypothetical protein